MAIRAGFRIVKNKSVFLRVINLPFDGKRESEKIAGMVQDGTAGGGQLQPSKKPVGKKQAPYHLQEWKLSEYWRMLECWNSHLHDTW